MRVIDAHEFESKIVISILIQEKDPYWKNNCDLLKMPRFQAAAKQLLARAERISDDYILVHIDRQPENFKSSVYIFTWIKK